MSFKRIKTIPSEIVPGSVIIKTALKCPVLGAGNEDGPENSPAMEAPTSIPASGMPASRAGATTLPQAARTLCKCLLFSSFHLSRVEFVKLAATYSTVNLGQGFPDFPPPEFLKEAFSRAVSGEEEHMLHQYTRAFVRGQPPARRYREPCPSDGP